MKQLSKELLMTIMGGSADAPGLPHRPQSIEFPNSNPETKR
ncbi:hypothetical protein [Pseudoalteromonas luteoviolacea]|uniref:Uncharacterized protein n=1 Tax=Pseudoalteromonas luteoviolacea S4054 TaxID=1129367 RepID=A0A0F6A547_9GAMM|nr:hypothetical protein [Pseudoalteromonas luteoviolacea]KKE81310.1 hypothetical protein N479_22505 [Pseudoalteromonas luteoviolacea S4054]KZN70681.1 hypothetical protein N481_20930 [Pseudoalteromonas luteoviolacea S4047-1]